MIRSTTLAVAVLTLWAGCSADQDLAVPNADPAWTAGESEVAPPPPITLAVTALRPGDPATLTTTGAVPGAKVMFGFSTALGSGPCPAALDGLCLDLVAPSLVGSAIADDSGLATLDFNVPPNAPPTAVAYFQSAELGSAPAVSPAVSETVQHPPMPNFSLIDQNQTSPTWGQPVSPRDHLARVSAWYFGHAT